GTLVSDLGTHLGMRRSTNVVHRSVHRDGYVGRTEPLGDDPRVTWETLTPGRGFVHFVMYVENPMGSSRPSRSRPENAKKASSCGTRKFVSAQCGDQHAASVRSPDPPAPRAIIRAFCFDHSVV